MLRRLTVGVCMIVIAGCVPTKARIDYTLSEGIIWPGGGQTPRISYLWSLSRVAGGDDSEFLSNIVGGYEYDPEFDYEPEDSEFLIRPHGVFVDGKDIMYITDPGTRRLSIINLKTMDSFNVTDAEGIRFLYPLGVVADDQGRIYMTDPDLRGLFVFDNKGDFLRTIGRDFVRPTGLAIDMPRGFIYVADTWGHIIYRYSLDGQLLGSIGQRGDQPGLLNYPTHIAVDGEGRLYVSDTMNFRVQIFSPDGTPVKTFGLQGDSFNTFDKIKGISVDSEGHIYIADSAQGMVKIYDQEGRLLLFFGKSGSRYGEFILPTGLYIDHANRVFVADSLNRRIQAFRFLGGN